VGKWETCFWFSTFPRPPRRSCGNVGISRCLRDFQEAVGRVGNLGLVFHAFHGLVISTAPLLVLATRPRQQRRLGFLHLARRLGIAHPLGLAFKI